MVKITVLKQDENEVKLLITNVTPGFLNLVRRTAMFEVPTLAIEDVYFSKNSSVLYDEMLAHRLGLIPLKTDLKSYVLVENCTCKGKLCAKCSVKGTLKAKGPATVYAEDLKFKDPSVKPVYPKMPIVKLIEGQEIELQFVAILGRGEEHAKWSPCHVYYSGWPEIKIENANVEKIMDSLPQGLVKKSGKALEVQNILEWRPAYEAILEKQNAEVSYRDDKFVFTIESWGQLPPKKILSEAASILKSELKKIKVK